jgi:hypothetical protein
MLCDGKGFNNPSVLDMRASAEVNEIAYFVHRCQRAIGYLALDQVGLKFVVLKQVKCFLF